MPAPRALPGVGRLLGVDLGDVRLGLALTDPAQVVASPVETLPIDDPDDLDGTVDVLVAAVERHEVVGIVVGLPRRLDAREGAAARRAREVANALEERTRVPTDLWDERFSTVEAERVMLAQDAKRRERRSSIDRVAASVILQGWLEARRQQRR